MKKQKIKKEGLSKKLITGVLTLATLAGLATGITACTTTPNQTPVDDMDKNTTTTIPETKTEKEMALSRLEEAIRTKLNISEEEKIGVALVDSRLDGLAHQFDFIRVFSNSVVADIAHTGIEPGYHFNLSTAEGINTVTNDLLNKNVILHVMISNDISTNNDNYQYAVQLDEAIKGENEFASDMGIENPIMTWVTAEPIVENPGESTILKNYSMVLAKDENNNLNFISPCRVISSDELIKQDLTLDINSPNVKTVVDGNGETLYIEMDSQELKDCHGEFFDELFKDADDRIFEEINQASRAAIQANFER